MPRRSPRLTGTASPPPPATRSATTSCCWPPARGCCGSPCRRRPRRRRHAAHPGGLGRAAGPLHHQPRVVVIGAGWIGMEAAAAARAHGCDVKVVSPAAPLVRALGDQMSGSSPRRTATTVSTCCSHAGIQSLRGTDRVEAVVTTDGRSSPPTWSCGHRRAPGRRLAAAAGLEVDEALAGAVVVDSSLRTSDPDVFATGDIAPGRACRWATAGCMSSTGPTPTTAPRSRRATCSVRTSPTTCCRSSGPTSSTSAWSTPVTSSTPRPPSW